MTRTAGGMVLELASFEVIFSTSRLSVVDDLSSTCQVTAFLTNHCAKTKEREKERKKTSDDGIGNF